jgi:hypothetical protein
VKKPLRGGVFGSVSPCTRSRPLWDTLLRRNIALGCDHTGGLRES